MAQTQIKNPEIQTKNAIWIKTWGERLNSPYPERRKLFVESNTDDVDELLGIIGSVRVEEEIAPWWLNDRCDNCKRQRDLSKKLNLPRSWRTEYCMRHGSLVAIDMLPLVDNKTRTSIVINNDLYYTIQSVKWLFSIALKRDYAIVNVYNRVYRNSFRFEYKNYGPNSSYSYILATVTRKLGQLADILNCEYDELGELSVYFNGKQMCEVEVEFE